MSVFADHLAAYLGGWANQMAGRFGRPVYLVGSALRLPRDEARDVDVCIVLPDDEFTGRYGDYAWTETLLDEWPEGARRWAADMGKLAGYVAKHYRLNLDMKVQSERVSPRHHGKGRRRLDEVDVERVPLVTSGLAYGSACECAWCVAVGAHPERSPDVLPAVEEQKV